MAYKDFYSRVPGVNATYNDGNLSKTTNNPAGPKILIAGASEKGINGRIYTAESLQTIINEFGEFSELANAAQLSLGNTSTIPGQAGAPQVEVVRVGAKEEHLLIKKVLSGKTETETIIRISPKRTGKIRLDSADVDVFSVLKLSLLPVKKNNIYKQRVIVYQINNGNTPDSVVYDSEMVLTQNLSDFEVEINNDVGIDQILFTPHAFDAAGTAKSLSSVIADIGLINSTNLKKFSDITIANIHAFNATLTTASAAVSANSYSLIRLQPSTTDISSISYLERFASMESKYEDLDYLSSEMIYCDGCYADVYPFDISNATSALAVDYGNYNLGYMWKYVYEGKPYVFMFGRKNPFLAANLGDENDSTSIVIADKYGIKLTAAQKAIGDLLNLVELEVVHGGTASVEIYPTDKGLIKVLVTRTDVNAAAAGINVGLFTLAIDANAGALAATRIRVSEVGGSRAISDYLKANPTSINSDPFVMTPYDLTGAVVPEAVLRRLLDWKDESDIGAPSLVASNDEVREISFLHQAAQLAYKASTIQTQCIAFVPTTAPQASSDGIVKWAGAGPTYVVSDSGELVVSSDGTKLQSNKLLFGASTYRAGRPFGGIILTTGALLPNGEPYGIDDQDEAVDEKGLPIDLGKHVVVCGSWGTIAKNTNNVSRIKLFDKFNAYVNLAPAIMGKLASLPINEEPIGPVNGLISGVTVSGAIVPKSILNNLALGRICMFDRVGALSLLRTAALPSSDYTRVSTIRAANRILNNVRQLALPFLGKTVDFARATLSQRIEGFMTGEVRLGNIQGYNPPVIQASRLDEIAGRMNVSVSFIPPFSLETVNVDLTVLPPQ